MSWNNEQTVDEETLRTIMWEVGRILTSGPLTKSTDNPSDLNVLTLNLLLLLNSNNCFPPGLSDCKDVYSRRRWRQMSHLANVFCACWRSEYLVLFENVRNGIKTR